HLFGQPLGRRQRLGKPARLEQRAAGENVTVDRRVLSGAGWLVEGRRDQEPVVEAEDNGRGGHARERSHQNRTLKPALSVFCQRVAFVTSSCRLVLAANETR